MGQRSIELHRLLKIRRTNAFFSSFSVLSFLISAFFLIVLHFRSLVIQFFVFPLPLAPLFFFFLSRRVVMTNQKKTRILIPLSCFHPNQPPADSPKHQQKIDKNSPGSSNNVGGAVGVAASLSGVGSSATLPSQGAHLPLGSVEAQLKYENDRLKLALAQR